MQPLEPYEIVNSKVEEHGQITTVWFETLCGKRIEFPLQHFQQKRQDDGQKAFSVFCSACDIDTPQDSGDFHGKKIHPAIWDELAITLRQTKPKPPQQQTATVRPSPQKREETGRFLYVISCEDSGEALCKIGIANSPETRLRTLSTASPHALRMELARYSDNARAVEQAAHSHFSDHRRNGEWFAIKPDQAIAYIISETRKAA
ncbi:hypothetical protein [Rhizobium phage RHph_X2_25]|nr:hypothetical protein [Rhizobium phage RHph_X2_25]